MRKCKMCGKDNPPTRYFNCMACQPVLESEEADTYPEGYDYGSAQTKGKVQDEKTE